MNQNMSAIVFNSVTYMWRCWSFQSEKCYT